MGQSMASSSKRAKAHHVLPQFYLKAWADENGLIAMVDRDGNEIRTGSKALAVENDFYTVKRPDGEKDASVEKALAEIDGQGAAAAAEARKRCSLDGVDERGAHGGLWNPAGQRQLHGGRGVVTAPGQLHTFHIARNLMYLL